MRHLTTSLQIIPSITLLLSSGCSLIFTSGPPPDHAKKAWFDCSTSQAPPVIDSLIAGFQVFRTAYALGQDDSDYEDFPISREADIAFGVVFLALFTGSAFYGYDATSECSDAKEQLEVRKNNKKFGPHLSRPHMVQGRLGSLQCTNDMQCAGAMICQSGKCVALPEPSPEPDLLEN